MDEIFGSALAPLCWVKGLAWLIGALKVQYPVGGGFLQHRQRTDNHKAAF